MNSPSVNQRRYPRRNEPAWSRSEKALAHKAFDAALERELRDVIREAKQKAGQIKEPADLLELEHYLTQRRKDIDRKDDYRYSQLDLVFADFSEKSGSVRKICASARPWGGQAAGHPFLSQVLRWIGPSMTWFDERKRLVTSIMIFPMPKPTLVCAVFLLLANGLACHTIDEDDLVGRYGFEKDSVRVELQINRDHTFSESLTDAGRNISVSGTWKYWDGPRNLDLHDVWVPFMPLASEQVHLRKTNFGSHVDPCGETLCLGIDDDNELRFVKKRAGQGF